MESTDHTTNHSNGDDAVKKEESGAEAVALTNEIKTVTEGTQMNADSKDLENALDAGGNDFYKMFINKKVCKEVADELIKMVEDLILNIDDFDERAAELLATFTPEQGRFIVKELHVSKLYGVHNKLQYIMSVMRNFKDRLRIVGPQQAISLPLIPGPEIEKIKEIIVRTGYQIEVTVGQRKYYLPLTEEQIAEGVDPANSGGCIYIGQIPKDVYEDTLIPLFEEVGKIYDLRIMMDPINGRSRGYGFLIYYEKSHGEEAAKKYDGHQILPGKAIKVNVSVANCRLFIGNIPKSKSKEEIIEELRKHAENVNDVIIYSNPDAPELRKNRGFCFVDFSDHKSASDAKRRISTGKIRPWNNDLVVDWAEQQEEPDDEVMSQVKVLYIRNLKEAVTEEKLRELFGAHGEIEKAKRIKDYAFIHFVERSAALSAMDALHKTVLDGIAIEVSLAKPQNDQKKKKFQMIKRGSSEFFPSPMRGGRYDYYQHVPMAPRGRGYFPRPMGYQPYPTPGPYDPYYSGHGSGYEYEYGGYEDYSGYTPDPSYYGASLYPPRPSFPRGRGMYGMRGVGLSGSGGAMRRGGSRGVKRTGGDFGGPVSKRGGHGHDFSSDTF